MLFCSESRVIPTNVNILVIQGEDGMYFYVHRQLYDQAVILYDKYGDKAKELDEQIGRLEEGESCESIDYFTLVVPEPLNILGHYLALVDDHSKLPSSVEDLCGVIHQMSSSVSFRNMLLFPKELRASVSFTMRITEEYKLSWDRFFQECIPYTDDLFLSGAKAYGGASNSSSNSSSTSSFQAETVEELSEEAIEKIYEDDGEGDFDWSSFVDDIGDTVEPAAEEKKEEVNVQPVDETANGMDAILKFATGGI